MPETMVDSRIIKDAVRLACRRTVITQQPAVAMGGRPRRPAAVPRPDAVVQSTDRSGREAIISCGAVLDHLRVAIAAGLVQHRRPVPQSQQPRSPGHASFLPMDFVTDAHRRRADAILLRRTDRLPLAVPPDWGAVELMLRAGARRRDLSGRARRGRQVATGGRFPAVGGAATVRFAISRRTKLVDGSFEPIDGIPYSSLISAAESERVEVGRTFPVTRHGERRPGIDDDRATVLVLSTDGDGPRMHCVAVRRCRPCCWNARWLASRPAR